MFTTLSNHTCTLLAVDIGEHSPNSTGLTPLLLYGALVAILVFFSIMVSRISWRASVAILAILVVAVLIAASTLESDLFLFITLIGLGLGAYSGFSWKF